MTVALDRDQEFLACVGAIAREIARTHAEDVDREARFPVEAVSALRDAGTLSAFVPTELGGGGVSLTALANATRELARDCSATAMVFAMHQIQVATIVRHVASDSWFENYLRELASTPRLIASVTSEVGTGGDLGRSIAPVHDAGDGRLEVVKQAPTVSYGGEADDFLSTARRSEHAAASDQVLVLSRREDTELEQTGTWDTIGMRGTCSPPFTVTTRFAADQVLAAPFATVLNESHVPISHILWSHAWLGIATEAFERARAFVRAAARRSPDVQPPAARGLSHVLADLAMLRAEVGGALAEFEHSDREMLSTMGSILRFNNLKLAASEQAPRICLAALEVIGIAAYQNDSRFGLGRQLRDSLSARLMVANERIHAMDAGLLLIAKDV